MEPIVIHYADDDTDDLQIFKNAVDKSAAPVALHTYNHGEEFLKNLKNKADKNSIVFLDINMPGKSGFDILKEIRRDDLLKKMPVIMYSTSSDDASIAVSREHGATMYAVKPTSFSDLKNMIRKAVATNWELFKSPPDSFILTAA